MPLALQTRPIAAQSNAVQHLGFHLRPDAVAAADVDPVEDVGNLNSYLVAV